MTNEPIVSDALVNKCSKLSSASLHEAGGKIGALPASIKPLAPHLKVCGRAYPVHSPPGDNLFLHHAIYAAQKGDILVVDCGEGIDYGYWGDIMASAAQIQGLGGLVISGGIRDSQQMIEMGFPVCSGAIAIRGTGKNPDADGDIGKPIKIGNVKIKKGDLVFGDADGVLVLPADKAEAIVDKAIARDIDEEDIVARMKKGETTLQIYKLPDLPAHKIG